MFRGIAFSHDSAFGQVIQTRATQTPPLVTDGSDAESPRASLYTTKSTDSTTLNGETHPDMSSGGFQGVRFPPKAANKKSIFERQRAEAEAKRQREAAETAAVYEDFVRSFDDGAGGNGGAEGSAPPTLPPGPLSGPPKAKGTIGATGGRRHFSMPSSGPSVLLRSSGPSSLGPGRGTTAKRRLAGAVDPRTRLAFGDDDDDDDEQEGDGHGGDERGGSGDEEGQVTERGERGRGSSAADRAEERAAAKPTIRLANLPPGTSPAAIRALVASGGSGTFAVDGVRILPASRLTSAAAHRKSLAAIVTLAAETAASDIDAAVSALQNRYLGFGYYLSLHRHLSSAVVSAAAGGGGAGAGSDGSGGSSTQQPFGAKPVPPPKPEGGTSSGGGSTGFVPPPPATAFHGGSRFHPGGGGGGGFGGHGRNQVYNRGIPPPPTYSAAGSAGVSRDSLLYVPVRAPRDIKKLRMIHKVAERVLDQGAAFEALLMSRPEVQHEEKWAWLWDARSEAGVWYRYRLWEAFTGLRTKRGQGRYVPLFEGSHAWKVPDRPLPYEFDTNLAELVSDSEYNSSDDSELEDGPGSAARTAGNEDGEDTFLNPLDKARLTHLLARLPTSLTRLRKGDIARVTAFAITHASRGAGEIVDMIVANVERPYAYTAANPQYQQQEQEKDDKKEEHTDTSGAQLIALYVVSDILSSSATSGIRHAWRFRQLFEAALRRRNVLEGLGLLAEKHGWGRLRADKWKRSVGLVLGHWEGSSVFAAETQEFLVSTFENPPSAKKDNGQTGVSGASEGAMAATASKKGRWKTVDTADAASGLASGFRPVERPVEAADGKMTERRDGTPAETTEEHDEWAYRSEYTDDEALDLACLDEEDIDGEPMDGDTASRYLDGTPLTAEEIRALVGDDVAEMSEEGEIGSDDEAYDMSGFSAISSGSSDGSQSGSDNERHRSDVEMQDAGDEPRQASAGREDTKDTKNTDSRPGPTGTTAPIAPAAQREPKLAELFQVAGARPTTGGVSRKRMRAVDMFANSEPDDSS